MKDERKNEFGDIGLGGRIILKNRLYKYNKMMSASLFGSKWGSSDRSFEQVKKFSVFIATDHESDLCPFKKYTCL
jgi:hypothetical protein